MGKLIKLVIFGIFASICVSYYGDDIIRVIQNNARLAGDAAPKQIASNANIAHTIQIEMQRDGHYWLDANINGNDVRFVVDTGASYITLSYNDAKKLGTPIFENDFNIVVNTAAGQTTMAEIDLDVIDVGAIELYNV